MDKIFLDIGDGPDGIKIYTNEEKAIVSHCHPNSLFIEVSTYNAQATFGPLLPNVTESLAAAIRLPDAKPEQPPPSQERGDSAWSQLRKTRELARKFSDNPNPSQEQTNEFVDAFLAIDIETLRTYPCPVHLADNPAPPSQERGKTIGEEIMSEYCPGSGLGRRIDAALAAREAETTKEIAERVRKLRGQWNEGRVVTFDDVLAAIGANDRVEERDAASLKQNP